MTVPVKPFLHADEPNPVELVRGRADSPFLITCDHAGNYFPAHCANLGLNDEQIRAHIAWDIGAAEVAKELARRLGATLILQRYSRLLIDCNRPPSAISSIPKISETTTIPGNLQLTDEQHRARQEAIFDPYHLEISAQLDQLASSGQDTILISVHSFTPVFKGNKREFELGILFNRDPRLGQLLLDRLALEADIRAMVNEPYAVSDATDYTIPQHAEARNIPHVMLEIRNSLITNEANQLQWASMLADWLRQAAQQLNEAGRIESHNRIKNCV